MAFLRRGLGRQGVGSCGPGAQPNPECGTSGVGFHPGASGLDGTLLKGGVTRASSWGAAWDRDTAPCSVGAGMAKHSLPGSGPSLFQSLVPKLSALFQAGWFLQCSLPSPCFTALFRSRSSWPLSLRPR